MRTVRIGGDQGDQEHRHHLKGHCGSLPASYCITRSCDYYFFKRKSGIWIFMWTFLIFRFGHELRKFEPLHSSEKTLCRPEMVKNLNCLMCTFIPSGTRGTLPSGFSCNTVNYPFCGLFSAFFFIFLCFFLVILLLKMVPKYSAKVLSNLPKHKKAVMCLYKENTCAIKRVWFRLSWQCCWLWVQSYWINSISSRPLSTRGTFQGPCGAPNRRWYCTPCRCTSELWQVPFRPLQ